MDKPCFLFGAGASYPAGIPTAIGMTERILQHYSPHSREAEVLRFVTGGVIFQKGVNGQDPLSGVNIEDVFNSLEMLSDRTTLEAAPFVGSWHERIGQLEDVPDVDPALFDRMQP